MSTAFVVPPQLARRLSRLDFNRITPTSSRVTSTEWTHLSVSTPEVTLVVNLSVEWLAGRPTYRLISLLYGDEVRGHVRAFSSAECSMPGGGTSQRLGESSLGLIGSSYRLRLREPAIELEADLELTPSCKPSLTSNMRAGEGGMLNWLVLPRLLAAGEIRCAGKAWLLSGVPAYRDRNWGSAIFAGDFSWDWGYAIDERAEPALTLVFARLLDARRTRTLQQNLFLWQGDELLALFRDGAITIAERGSARFGRIPTFPRALALTSPGHATALPEGLTLSASAHAGVLCVHFRVRSLARILIPRRGKQGISKVNEALGEYEVNGSVGGRPIVVRARGFFERVHA